MPDIRPLTDDAIYLHCLCGDDGHTLKIEHNRDGTFIFWLITDHGPLSWKEKIKKAWAVLTHRQWVDYDILVTPEQVVSLVDVLSKENEEE